ncbi:alpha/beta fold hydrolase [Halorientalis salina]|uniref:alpha/beta fold hydrolase n=1 Tax=Halorientalis salina TaxID=2932266 RepID=UPI0010AC77EF|nr:alpha/beta hydrolase [Halorientalis salina]
MTDATTHEDWTVAQTETTVTVDGHELTAAYWDSSEAMDGETASEDPPVVFLHGIPTWSFLWRDVAPAVAEETGRRVVAPDLVGYGNSDMRDCFDRSIRAQEAMLDDLFDQLGVETCALVAHDIGGGVALRYAAHNPTAVSKLVLSNAVCYDSWPVGFITDLGLPRTTEMPLDTLEEQVGGAFSEGVYADEAEAAFVEGMTQQWTDETGRTSLSRNAVATNTNHTTELDYDAIDADFLALWGSDDEFQPIEYAHRLTDDLGGEVVELDAYHWVVEDRPERYTAEVSQFLTE